jgi:hypothetical protein
MPGVVVGDRMTGASGRPGIRDLEPTSIAPMPGVAVQRVRAPAAKEEDGSWLRRVDHRRRGARARPHIRDLDPVGTVPRPGVVKELLSISLATEGDHLTARLIAGCGDPTPRRRAHILLLDPQELCLHHRPSSWSAP